MPSTPGVNGRAMVAVGFGILLVWSGIKGWSMLGTLGDVISGRKPAQPQTNPAGLFNPRTNVSGTLDTPGVTGIASTALQHQGHPYKFGGAPGRDGTKPWDCSSFVNWVVGVVHGMAIPGYAAGKYDGSSHGPTTGEWGVWPGLTRVSRSEVTTGDIVVWVGHMGIAVDNTRLIAARNPKAGTGISDIDHSGSGPIMCYGRLH